MRKKSLIGGVATALALCLSTGAHASTSTDLLKRLHEKGILTDDEYNQLLAEEQAQANAAPATPVTPPPAPATPPPAMEQAQGALDSSHLVKMTDSGIGLMVGPATIKFSGSVNGFYVYDNPQKNAAKVVGGLASTGTSGTSAVRNGLLPGFFKIDVTTNQGGWDVGAHFGMYPGINSNSWAGLGANSAGQATAFATSGIDFRQTYMTVGKPGFGELKIGRDIGLFGSEAILNDMTLLSVGSTGGNVAPSNTSLGRIGIGYIYTDFQPQITYTTPKMGGFQAALGIFQPLQSLTSPAQTNSSPGFQGKISFDAKFAGAGFHGWVSAITQQHNTVGGGDYTGEGIDLGAKVTVGPIGVTGYWYKAKGLGTEALGLFDADALGNARKSNGYYIQAMATLGKFSVGGSYGASFLHTTNADDFVANQMLVHENSSEVGQVRYGLTSWVTLIGEYTHTKARADNGNVDTSDALALGGILFF